MSILVHREHLFMTARIVLLPLSEDSKKGEPKSALLVERDVCDVKMSRARTVPVSNKSRSWRYLLGVLSPALSRLARMR
jgi:hypothetical protein